MTDLELAANEEARHGNRDALENITEGYFKLFLIAVEAGLINPDEWKLGKVSD